MSRRPCPVLQDMPLLIKQRIANKLERYTDKMVLRNFSPDFRQTIGDPVAHVQHLELRCRANNIISLEIVQNTHHIVLYYQPSELGCVVKKRPYSANKYLVKDRGHAQVALEDFQAYVDNPNLTVDKFWLTVRTPEVFGILGKLIPGKLKVSDFTMCYSGLQEAVLPVLSHLDSHFLNDLDLSVSGNQTVLMEFEELVKLDQWKSLEHLRLCEVLSLIIPAEHLSHVPIVSLSLDSSLAQLPAMINQFRGSTTFKRFIITTSLNWRNMKNAIRENAPPGFQYDSKSCVFEYPATSDQFGMKILITSDQMFGIWKKHRF